MEIKGKVVAVLPTQSGTSSNGAWTKQEIVIETAGTYPKKVCFAIPKEKIGKLKVGANVTAEIDVVSREYNNKWYTNVNAWKISVNSEGVSTPADSGTDDLPF